MRSYSRIGRVFPQDLVPGSDFLCGVVLQDVRQVGGMRGKDSLVMRWHEMDELRFKKGLHGKLSFMIKTAR